MKLIKKQRIKSIGFYFQVKNLENCFKIIEHTILEYNYLIKLIKYLLS